MAITICVTGHIDLKDPKKIKNEIIYFLRYIKETNPNTEIIALSAMAAGSDTIFAQAVLDVKIPLKIILPFQIEDYEKNFNKEDWQTAKKIISSNEYYVNETIDYKNSENRNNAYLSTGKKLVDGSNMVLAIWDGKDAVGVGGTGDIVKYVRQNNSKELHIIKAARNKKSEENDLLNKAQELFDELDAKAINKKKYQFNLIWIAGIIFGLLGVVLFFYKNFINKNSHLDFTLSFYEVILILISLILLNVFVNRSKINFLTLRRDAEYLRSIIIFSDGGIPIPKIDFKGYNPSYELINLESKIKEQTSQANNFPNSKRSIWSLIVQQIDYQTLKRKIRVEKRLSNLTKWMNIIKWTFFGLFFLNFAFETNHHFHIFERINYESFKDWLFFSLSILPPFFAALEGVKFFGDYNNDIKIIDDTVNQLKKLEGSIVNCKDEKNLTDITLELRKTLEKENIDWANKLKEKHIEKGA